MSDTCAVCGQSIGGRHGTESMAHGPCQFIDGDVRCVFGPAHTVGYHHLGDGRNVPAEQESALDRLPLRFEQEAARQLDVALGFTDRPAVAAKCRGKAIAFACAADWLRDALNGSR